MAKSNAEKQAAYRERKAREYEEAFAAALFDDGVWEQELRDRWGYSSSETRTKAERDRAAAGMLAGSGRGKLVGVRFAAEGVAREMLAKFPPAPDDGRPVDGRGRSADFERRRAQRAVNHAIWLRDREV